MGFGVIKAGNGREAIDYAYHQSVLIFRIEHAPNGWFYRYFDYPGCRARATIPVIALTADAMKETGTCLEQV